MRYLLLIFTCAAQAQTWSEPSNLKLVYPARSRLQNPVNLTFSLDGDLLRARFEVHARELYVKKDFGPRDFPFMYDVVELFVTVQAGADYPYYEFELTPLNQTLQVKVAGATQFINHVEVGFQSQVQQTSTGWRGEMSVPLRNLGWDGDPQKIRGNAFAIQGKGPGRSYWSLNLPPQRRPNFHQPRYFRALLN